VREVCKQHMLDDTARLYASYRNLDFILNQRMYRLVLQVKTTNIKISVVAIICKWYRIFHQQLALINPLLSAGLRHVLSSLLGS
jgi:hypothetical protein